MNNSEFKALSQVFIDTKTPEEQHTHNYRHAMTQQCDTMCHLQRQEKGAPSGTQGCKGYVATLPAVLGKQTSTNSNRSTHRRQNKQVHRGNGDAPRQVLVLLGSGWVRKRNEEWFSEELAFTAESGETQGNTSEVGTSARGNFLLFVSSRLKKTERQAVLLHPGRPETMAQSHLLYKRSSDGDFKCCKMGKPHKHSLGAGKSALSTEGQQGSSPRN